MCDVPPTFRPAQTDRTAPQKGKPWPPAAVPDTLTSVRWSLRQLEAVPAHLRRYVVGQDYDQYTEMDHAVWRFVLLQTHARLTRTAHPAYESGLAATGIRVDAIPRIAEMQEKLSRFGWSAVCVDGFIPPRAFQSFQANRILPIAAEIRTSEHLAYTPAPDIIHEAAGHAPILSHPVYAEFVQRFGAISEKAFGSPDDRAVHQAIHLLSELKESSSSTPAQIEAATRALADALGRVSELSESARLSRLYWWTAEYGLIGSVRNFKLYGAGLLSSLGEGQSCLDAAVQKLPLSADCVRFDYDITRAQPQLFVARDFEQLLEVLEEVGETLAYRGPSRAGLAIAQRSEELATLSLSTGLALCGVVSDVALSDDETGWVQLSGNPALFDGELPLADAPCPNEYVLPLGRLRTGVHLSECSRSDLARYEHDGQIQLTFADGMMVTGEVRAVHERAGRARFLLLERFALTAADGRVFTSRTPYPLALGQLVGVCAGAPAAYFGSSDPSHLRVPRPHWLRPHESRLLALYERAVEAWKGLAGSALVAEFEQITRALDSDHPDDWLLRWNLLESLVKVAEDGPLAERLTHDLELLEIKYLHKEPIATGLSHIRTLVRRDAASSAPP